MSEEDENPFDRWLLPILVGLSLWGWALGLGFILLTGAQVSFDGIEGLMVSTVLSLLILRTTDPKTQRQLGLVAAIGAGAIALTVLAVFGLFALLDGVGIRETGFFGKYCAHGLAAVLCFFAGYYGSKLIYQRLGVPLRDPGKKAA